LVRHHLAVLGHDAGFLRVTTSRRAAKRATSALGAEAEIPN
jgi:hypothetical protein